MLKIVYAKARVRTNHQRYLKPPQPMFLLKLDMFFNVQQALFDSGSHEVDIEAAKLRSVPAPAHTEAWMNL